MTTRLMSCAVAAALLLVAGTGSRADQPPMTRPRPEQLRGASKGSRVWALRLTPGQDLRRELDRFARENGLQAGYVVTCVGSLRTLRLRYANQPGADSLAGHFEIVSLTGTFGQEGAHLHLAASDSTGRTLGGHLLDGCEIYTTAEIVLGDATGLRFARQPDSLTTYRELRIESRR